MQSDRKITRHHLRARDADAASAFYGDLLGMRDFGAEAGARLFGYDPAQCLLALHPGATQPYEPIANDFYWKIGITLANLDAAVRYLRDRGHPVRDPVQFRDIGYMTHLSDPDGLSIELLQHGFEGREKPAPDGHPIGAQATIAHITLRVSDIDKAQRYLADHLDMRLMSVQPVAPYGFCLYFYTWSDDTLPNPDLDAVENREWLWSRPYALVELQHLTDPTVRIRMRRDASRPDFMGLSYAQGAEAVFLSVDDLERLT